MDPRRASLPFNNRHAYSLTPKQPNTRETAAVSATFCVQRGAQSPKTAALRIRFFQIQKLEGVRIKVQVDALYFDNSKFRERGPINTIVEREQRKAVLNCMRTD
jgi:hypothetical protein